jgi:hypothetical protein
MWSQSQLLCSIEGARSEKPELDLWPVQQYTPERKQATPELLSPVFWPRWSEVRVKHARYVQFAFLRTPLARSLDLPPKLVLDQPRGSLPGWVGRGGGRFFLIEWPVLEPQSTRPHMQKRRRSLRTAVAACPFSQSYQVLCQFRFRLALLQRKAQIRAADRSSGTPAVLPSRYVASVDHTGLLRRSARCSVITCM